MKTASVLIIYDPLEVSFDVEMLGGNAHQRLDAASRQYEPNRSITPLRLRPRLQVKDPNHVLEDGDHSTDLIDCRWHMGRTAEAPTVHRDTQGFELREHGVLDVRHNVEPGQAQYLYLTCKYIDPRTEHIYEFEYELALTCDLTRDWNLRAELNVPRKWVISPYRQQAQREISVTVHNGSRLMPPSEMDYLWQVYDARYRVYRVLDAEEDLWYVSGDGTDRLTVDGRYIEKVLLQVTCRPKTDSTVKTLSQLKAMRWYGQWDEREVVTKGKYLRPGMTEVEVECIIDTPRGQLSHPEQYFDIEHVMMRKEAGSHQSTVGYGPTVVMNASYLPRDPHVEVVFGCIVSERTALHAATIEGHVVTVGGKTLTIRSAKK